MPATSRRKKNQLIVPSAIIFIIILIALFFVYKNGTNKSQATPENQITIDQPSSTKPPANLDREKPTEAATQTATEKKSPILPNATESEPQTACEEASENLHSFFSSLQNKKYIKAYDIKEGLTRYFNKISIKLLNNPPKISQKPDDLLSLLKNAAHFYQVLGPKDLSLIKDILVYEGENTESIFDSLYQWHKTGMFCQRTKTPFILPLKKVYEYACFFLNTLEGQTYLFRRDSKTRVLIEYYSLLILFEAEKKGLNKYNFAVTEQIPKIKKDIESSPFLVQKTTYLETIATLTKPQK